jgi:O-antigen ligase
VNDIVRRGRNASTFLCVALLGSLLSLILDRAWELDTRWTAIVFLAVVAIGISLCLVHIFSDLLLRILLFCLPFAVFVKWILPGDVDPRSYGALAAHGVLGVGLIDFILIGLYMSWFYRIFVVREERLPQLTVIDGLVLWFFLANLLAAIGSKSMAAGFGSTEYLLKNIMFYFYVSRHLEERHLPWVLAAFAFTIFIEAPLSAYQFRTGHLVGLALDKGAGGGALNEQYVVPGTEGYSRATGTAYDSHTLGEFVGALLPFALVLFFTPRFRPVLKLGCLVAGAGAVLVVVLSLSRTGWLASAVTLALGVVLIVAVWRERQVIPALAGFVALAVLAGPFLAPVVYERFANAPVETVTTRFDMFNVALHIFGQHPVFGVGPANYSVALREYDFLGMQVLENGQAVQQLAPVHNSFLCLAAEIGGFGLLAYLCLLTTATWKLFSLACSRNDIPGRFALAAVLGLATIVLNDQFNASFREADVFLTFWLLIALSVALPRLRPDAGEILMAPRHPPPAAPPTAVATERAL